MNLTEGEKEQEEGKEAEERDEEEEQKEEDKEGKGEEAQEEEGSNMGLVDKSISCFVFFVFLSFFHSQTHTSFSNLVRVSGASGQREVCASSAAKNNEEKNSELLLSGFRLEVFPSDVSCQTRRFPV